MKAAWMRDNNWLEIAKEWREQAMLVLLLFVVLIGVFRVAACAEHSQEVRWGGYWENKNK